MASRLRSERFAKSTHKGSDIELSDFCHEVEREVVPRNCEPTREEAAVGRYELSGKQHCPDDNQQDPHGNVHRSAHSVADLVSDALEYGH